MLKQLQTCLYGLGLRWQLAVLFFLVPLLLEIFFYFQIARYGEQVLETSSYHLMRKSRDELFSRIDNYLAYPESMVQFNTVLASHSLLPLDDQVQLSRIFFDQVFGVSHSLEFFFYANENGGIVSAGSYGGKRLIATNANLKNGDRVINQVDANGRFLAPFKRVHGYDPRQRAWYRLAKARRALSWAGPWPGSFLPSLTIHVVNPFFSKSGELLGFFGADRSLDKLTSFLQSLHISPHGYAYLTESDGTLLGNSTNSSIFIGKPQKLVRMKAKDSPDPLIRKAALIIEQMNQTGKRERYSGHLDDTKGGRYFLDISPYSYKDHFTWYVIMVVPRADFTQELETLFQKILLISLLGLAGALILSWRMGKWVTVPIQSVKNQVREVAHGHFGGQVMIQRTDEIGELALTFNDMSTRLGQAYKELQIAKEAAESSSRIKSEFLDIAAHELRTPLTPITLLIQRAQRLQMEGKPIPASYLDLMAQQMRRLTKLMDDLLNISRLERGGPILHRVRADLISIIRECLEEFKDRAPFRPYSYEGPKVPIFLDLDSIRIHQVLTNFLDNALKYTPEKSPIKITVVTMPEKVRVSVIDQGEGIPKDKQTELFSKFYRASTDATLRQPGLGLGLYICRQIVESHGGTIGIESEPGEGSTFFFELSRKPSRVD